VVDHCCCVSHLVVQLEDDLESTKSALKAKSDKSSELGVELSALEVKLSKLGVRQEELKQMQDAIAHMQAQKQVMIEERQRANAKMQTDYSDTDAELRSIYDSFKSNHAALVRQIEERQAQLQQVEADCAKSERDMQKLAETLGKLAAQESDYRRRKAQLTEMANRIGNAGGAAAVDPARLLTQLQANYASKQSELEQQKAEARALDSKYEADLADLRKQDSQLNEAIRIKTEQMNDAKQKRSAPRKWWNKGSCLLCRSH